MAGRCAAGHRRPGTEDDTGKPTICMYDEDGPPSTSQQRLEDFGEAIWAVYDLKSQPGAAWTRALRPLVQGPSPVAATLPLRQRQSKYKKCCGA